MGWRWGKNVDTSHYIHVIYHAYLAHTFATPLTRNFPMFWYRFVTYRQWYESSKAWQQWGKSMVKMCKTTPNVVVNLMIWHKVKIGDFNIVVSVTCKTFRKKHLNKPCYYCPANWRWVGLRLFLCTLGIIVPLFSCQADSMNFQVWSFVEATHVKNLPVLATRVFSIFIYGIWFMHLNEVVTHKKKNNENNSK